MTGAFCPGHVSCVFQPCSSINPLSTGSRGIGIRLNLGSHVKVEPRDDGEVNIRIDGLASVAPVTRMMAELLSPSKGYDIVIENDLPVSQGFGMSASGALAAAVAIAHIDGKTRQQAFEAAHIAEVKAGGGLGDVPAIVGGSRFPIRTVPGLPPRGRVEHLLSSEDPLTVFTMGAPIKTPSVLGDPEAVRRIRAASERSLEEFLAEPSVDMLFKVSNDFSEGAELETPAMKRALDKLRVNGFRAGMCMLGNSVFTDAPRSDVFSLFGRGHVRAYECTPTKREIIVTRKA